MGDDRGAKQLFQQTAHQITLQPLVRQEEKNRSVLLQTLCFIEPQISLIKCIHFAGIQKRTK